MSTQDSLESLTEFSAGGDTRRFLPECRHCNLQILSPYSLVFYTKQLQASVTRTNDSPPKKSRIRIMFVSRDPNIAMEEVKQAGGPINAVLNWNPPRKNGLGSFFNDFLIDNALWNRFLDYLDDPVVAPEFYWTHMVKCHTYNNDELVAIAKAHCRNYLCTEIETLQPRLLIAAGLDVARAIAECKLATPYVLPSNISTFKDVSPNNASVYQAKTGIIVIPHPSQAWYHRWKSNKFKIGMTHNQLQQII